jgi:hypothetical protein
MTVWLFKFATKFVTKLREMSSYWLQSLSLQKHVGHWKTTIHSLGVVVGDHYYCKDIAHYKKEKVFSKQSSKFVMTLMQFGIHLGFRK